MSFTDLFIRRPVFASALNLMVLMAGLVSFMNMAIREYPNVAANVITVTTNYPGATASLMAGFVTTPLENAISSVDGIDYMYSSSVESQSIITIYFKLGTSIDAALADVLSESTSVMWQLPPDVQQPIIQKSDTSESPTVYVAFKSKTLSAEAVTDYLIRIGVPQLQMVDGVSTAQIYGEREYAMRVSIDPYKLASFDLTAAEVWRIINESNVQAAPGTVYSPMQQFNATITTDLSTVEEFQQMILRQDGNSTVRLKDVADVELGPLSLSSSANIDGKPTITVGITPKSNANTLLVSEQVESLIEALKPNMPQGLNAEVIYDKAEYIQAAIDEVYSTVFEAVIFVVIIMFMFLGSFRTILIPIVTIPLSIIGVCSIMMSLGYTINLITLLAWVLAIGLVVDDAIVVVENIERHIHEGKSPMDASLIGTREIGFAIVAMTATLAAVYVPIGFTEGMTGILFREFAFTLASSVVVSGFVALTLSPMMCARVLKAERPKLAIKLDEIFEKFRLAYRRFLKQVLGVRWLIVILMIGLYFICGFLYKTLPSELAPTEDQGLVTAFMFGPGSANIKFTENYSNRMMKVYDSIPEMTHYGIIVGYPSGVNSGLSFMALENWDKRTRSASDIAQAIFPYLWSIPGLKIIPFAPPPLPGSGELPVEIVLKATAGGESYPRLEAAMEEMLNAAKQFPGFTGLNTDLIYDQPQTHITIDRDKAAALGVSMKDIAATMAALYAEPQSNQFSMFDRAYFVVPELEENFNFQADPSLLNNVQIRTRSGELVAMSNLVTISDEVAPESLPHFQQLPSATLQSSVTEGYTLGELIEYLQAFAKDNLPNDIIMDYSGQSRQLLQASGAMEQALMFAVIFIFLVLAAQFESYRDPLIVMLVVPVTLAGALITLKAVGGVIGSLSIYTQIGLVTLVGLIAKHGILIVEFANQLQMTKGLSRMEAALESASIRLRPILMTTGAMVLGAVPLMVASGAGAVSRNQLGTVIVSGMLFGTLCSLFIVPTAYSLLAQKHIQHRKEDEPGNEAATPQ